MMALEDRPLNDNEPATLASHKGLLIGAGVGGLVLALGFAALVFLLIYRMSGREESIAVAASWQGRPALPDDARMVSTSVAGRWLLIDVDLGADGRAVLVVDPETGREQGRILLPPTRERP